MKKNAKHSGSNGVEADDCLELINQSVFSQRSYLEWKEVCNMQNKPSGSARNSSEFHSDYKDSRRLSNNSEELLSTCSTSGFDSRYDYKKF